MDKFKANEILVLFNEKVDKLLNSGFVKHIQQEGGLKVTLNASVNKPLEIIDNLPRQDAVDAFVLTLRFFIQNNESTSLQNMEKLYNEITISPTTKMEFNSVKDKLNSELSKDSGIHLQGKSLTLGDIFETFIYGGLAHANPKLKKTFDSWMQMREIRVYITATFNSVLMYFLACIARIKAINLITLKEI